MQKFQELQNLQNMQKVQKVQNYKEPSFSFTEHFVINHKNEKPVKKGFLKYQVQFQLTFMILNVFIKPLLI